MAFLTREESDAIFQMLLAGEVKGDKNNKDLQIKISALRKCIKENEK